MMMIVDNIEEDSKNLIVSYLLRDVVVVVIPLQDSTIIYSIQLSSAVAANDRVNELIFSCFNFSLS